MFTTHKVFYPCRNTATTLPRGRGNIDGEVNMTMLKGPHLPDFRSISYGDVEVVRCYVKF